MKWADYKLVNFLVIAGFPAYDASVVSLLSFQKRELKLDIVRFRSRHFPKNYPT